MENEINAYVGIAVSLVVLGALIGFIFYTVDSGRGLINMTADSGDELNNMMDTAYLDSVSMGTSPTEVTEVLALSVYYKYGKVINYAYCGECGGTFKPGVDELCFKSTPSGKCSIEVKKSNDLYYMIVHNVDCTWEAGTCTCLKSLGVRSFKLTYGLN